MNFLHLACRIPFCVFHWFCPSVSFTSLFSSICPLMFQQKVPGLGLSCFEQVYQCSLLRKPRLFRNIKIFRGNYLSILTRNLSSLKTFLSSKSLNQVSTKSLPSSLLVNPQITNVLQALRDLHSIDPSIPSFSNPSHINLNFIVHHFHNVFASALNSLLVYIYISSC